MKKIILVVTAVALLASGCKTANKQQKGTAIGAAGGAAVGAIVGKGSIWGTVLGAVIIGVLNNGLVLLDVSPFWQQVVKGAVILLAVIIDKTSSKND